LPRRFGKTFVVDATRTKTRASKLARVLREFGNRARVSRAPKAHRSRHPREQWFVFGAFKSRRR
jgi:hypothetical protein